MAIGVSCAEGVERVKRRVITRLDRLEPDAGTTAIRAFRGPGGGNASRVPDKLHVAVIVAEIVWPPLAATLTAADVAGNKEAPALLADLPAAVGAIQDGRHYTDPDLVALTAQSNRPLITTKRAAHPHTDAGVEVQRLFHQPRSHAVENFNSLFKALFHCLGQVPTHGLRATARYTLGAVLLSQLTAWKHHRVERDLHMSLKSFVLSP